MDSRGWMRLTIVFCLLFLTSASWAGDDLLEVLRKNGTITRDEYKSLKKKQNKSEREKVKEGLKFESQEGDFSIRVGGRLMVDAAFYDDDVRELGNGTELRRVRIFVEGKIYRVWEYKAEFDFAGGEVSVKDAYLGYKGFKSTLIQIGYFKEPFSLEEHTSSKYITFMERAMPNVFAPGRNIGIGFITHGDNWTLAAGAFAESVGDEPDGDEGYGLSGRITFAPWYEKTRAVHLGLSAAFRKPDAMSKSILYRERPESHITGVRLVNTGPIGGVDSYANLAAEAAAVYGPISFQGEYFWSHVNRMNFLQDLDFHGFYVFGSWFLTGESRKYSAKNGKFSRIKPKNNFGKEGAGAWEAAVRFSHLDLTDGLILGGEEENITFGLNWYINPQLRFMANIILVNTDTNAGNDDPRVFQIRAQIDF